MDFFVVLERPGFRVAKRRRKQAKIGAPHKLKKADAMKFFQSKFDGIILGSITVACLILLQPSFEN